MDELGQPRRISGVIPVRLRVGVTGHRTLPDDSALTEAVDQVLDRIRESVPHTPVTLDVVSSLAEGADRLVARRILRDSKSRLLALLPLAPDDYRNDFAGDESKEEFDSLLVRASAQEVIPGSGKREEAYLQAGFQLVERCDLLVTLWDGKPPRGEGGTAQIKERAEDRKITVYWIDTAPPFAIKVTEGEASRASFEELDHYNSERLDPKRLADEVRRRGDDLLVEGQSMGLAAEYLRPFFLWILPYFIRADALARRYQKRFFVVSDGLFALGVLAVVSVTVQALFFPERHGLAWIEVSWLGMLIVLFGAGRLLRLHARWLSQRHLAERLRSAMFLAIASSSMDSAAAPVPIELGSFEDPVKEWPRRAFEEVWNLRPTDASTLAMPHLKQFLAQAWMQDQIDYHKSKGREHEWRHRFVTYSSISLFAAALLAAILHATLKDQPGSDSTMTDTLVLLAISLPTGAGALAAIGAQRELRRNSVRSRRTASDLAAIKVRLESASDDPAFRAAVAAASDMMLGENRDWIDAMRFHEVELHGG